jgi:predicted nucleotidyltransferase
MRKKNPIDALFPKIRQNILAAAYGQPEKWWFMSELAAFIQTTPSSLQRELASLVESGILRQKRDGNRLYVQAETDSPIFAPLRELVTQTLGIPQKLKESLLPLAKKIDCAFIYGSVARREEHSLSDIDLIIIGSVGLAEISPLMRELERRFHREINATCYSAEEFCKKIQAENHFLTDVLKKEKIFLIGDEDELEKLAGKPNSAEPRYKSSGNRKPARVG